MALRNAKGCLKDLKQKNDTIKKEREELDKKFRKVEQEKESMYKKFEQAIEQLRSRADYKNEKLEEKLAVFEGELDSVCELAIFLLGRNDCSGHPSAQILRLRQKNQY